MIYLITAAALILYLLLAWFLGSGLGLKSPDIWILRGGLALIGFAAAAVFLWYRAKKEREKPAGDTAPAGGDDFDALLNEAAAKLASSRLQQGASFGALPVIFVLGPAGSTKTTAVVNSGLDPELLAGQIYQDSAVVPTRSANLWFARNSVFVEASGRLLGDIPAWNRLIRRMQPRRLGSLFGKGEQAPRAAVVCLSCDIFLKPGAAENVPTAARSLAARLGEISHLLGINVPVYVLFTKLDRLSFFHEYVQNLSESEVTQVLGVTLPAVQPQPTGVYAEQESARLTAAFNELFYSLSEKRTSMLSREHESEKLPGIYEFPREFRKLRTFVTQFLVDLCRPSQLSTGPFLRGFYFCGVRPVIVKDVVTAAAARPSFSQSAQARGDATGIFRLDQAELGQGAPVAAAPAASTRKVPQWVFLNHFFSGVLLTDRTGLGASGSSVKTNTLRRVLLASAAALCLLLCLAFTISWAGNRSLESEARLAAEGISTRGTGGANLPSFETVNRLETLRQSLETLARYEREGAPLHLRWGLYAGSEIYPSVRRLYFDRFHQLLFGQTQTGLLSTLQGLPGAPGPTDDYGYAYDTLKAYLITTSHHDKSSQAFLSPLLHSRWAAGRAVDPDVSRLAQKQFDFYSEELRLENPYPSRNDGAAIEKARMYLSLFAGVERVYQVMLAEANKSNPAVNFNRKFPGSAEVVINDKNVPGAYTKAGWTFMQNAIKNADSFFTREEWVLGQQSGAKGDRAKLEQDLRTRYYADFINQWQDYLKKSVVVRYRDFGDAAKKLSKIDGPQSPLLAMFWLASQNTGVDAPDVLKAFKPLHAVMPPASVDQYIVPSNADYMKALVPLQLALEQVATLPPAQNEQAAEQTRKSASDAKLVTRQMALTLALDQTVLKLLEDPITNAVGSIPAPPAPGKGLCIEFRGLSAKYPFNPNATTKATLDEVAAFFAPQKGALWTFYEANLKKVLTPQGVLIPGVSPAPPAGIVRFFNRAAGFSNALYPGGSATPRLAYSLKPVMSADIQSLRLGVDGQTGDFPTPGAPAKQFIWPGSSAHEVRLSGKFKGGSDFVFPSYDGLWAVFEFFNDADRYQAAGSGASLEWMLRGGRQGRPVTSPSSGQPLQVRFDLDMAGAPPVFQKGYFASLACSETAR
jgi:type VI secretion system protein ImpL